ncbi:pentatricopeptide repeat-containing protein [Citrus sinensis]|nr:pentatricopeptide repeat-containing protein [Citrus sinensis]
MIRNLKTQLRFTFYHSQPIVQSNAQTYFRTEQFSNDYISSLCKQNLYNEALVAFDFLQNNTNFRIRPSTYADLISACSSLRSLQLGRKVHDHILSSKCQPDAVLHNHILNMYGKCGSLEDARMVFDEMPQRNVVSWTAMIAGCSQNGQENAAIELYVQMLQSGLMPDQFTFGSIIRACSGLCCVGLGRQLHAHVIKSEHGSHLISQNALIAMYTKFDRILDAWNVFSSIARKDITSWGSMIDGFSKLGCELEALSHFNEMLHHGGYQPNEFIFGSVFSACSTLLHHECGRQVHDFARTVFNEMESPNLASWNTIIAGVASCSNANEAMSLFSEMGDRELIPDGLTVRSLLCACTSPLSLYQGMQIHSYIIKKGFYSNVPVCNAILHQAGELFRLFSLMLASQTKPDHITFNDVMGACAAMASLEMGTQLHCYIMKTGLALDVFVMNGLMDMLDVERKLFNFMEDPDVVSWSSLIVGYAQFGCGEEALKLFRRMRSSGVRPNHVTLVGVLTACSHVGLVEEGLQLYRIMQNEYGIIPTRERRSCVVDLLARAGRVHEAEDFINQMAFDDDIVVWKSLLASCKTHGNVDVGKRAAENILKIDPTNSAALVLLCNIYASSGKWEEVARLMGSMKERGVRKVPGQSWIEIQTKIHASGNDISGN